MLKNKQNQLAQVTQLARESIVWALCPAAWGCWEGAGCIETTGSSLSIEPRAVSPSQPISELLLVSLAPCFLNHI